ncbi:hypothetical protein EVJ58_g2653 [Rhodofomes roseus]|uniref:Uncharacterized protein n=1 Tax=Rhodofomes roseus TaxID=34475 RepID=A0A4Y9YTF3_9APHY|nr:hypothetical protein EVJ58_g2653 [Rhodofomes roseus]
MARASKDSGKTEQTPLPHPQENAKPDDWMDTFQAPGRVTTKFVDPCKRAAKRRWIASTEMNSTVTSAMTSLGLTGIARRIGYAVLL